MSREWKVFGAFTAVFVAVYYLPFSYARIQAAILEAFRMLQRYARNHTLAGVVPALFTAGAITAFLSKEAVLRRLGPKARKAEAYSVASVSGTVPAVCSCSVLPIFTGIYRVGAGLGPAATFLYAGPTLNILAVFLTARVLGFELGLWRAIGAVVFGMIVGILMAAIFRKDEQEREAATMQLPDPPQSERSLWQTAVCFAAIVLFLVFGGCYNPGNVVVHLTDGGELQVVMLQETRDDVLFQVEQPVASYRLGDKVRRGLLVTPALVIDGTVKLIGKAASPEEIAGILSSAARIE